PWLLRPGPRPDRLRGQADGRGDRRPGGTLRRVRRHCPPKLSRRHPAAPPGPAPGHVLLQPARQALTPGIEPVPERAAPPWPAAAAPARTTAGISEFPGGLMDEA